MTKKLTLTQRRSSLAPWLAYRVFHSFRSARGHYLVTWPDASSCPALYVDLPRRVLTWCSPAYGRNTADHGRSDSGATCGEFVGVCPEFVGVCGQFVATDDEFVGVSGECAPSCSERVGIRCHNGRRRTFSVWGLEVPHGSGLPRPGRPRCLWGGSRASVLCKRENTRVRPEDFPERRALRNVSASTLGVLWAPGDNAWLIASGLSFTESMPKKPHPLGPKFSSFLGS